MKVSTLKISERHRGERYGEGIYIKDKRKFDFSNPYLSFPFIKSGFDYAGYLIIEDTYHDTMFAYSELATNRLDLQSKIGNSVSNGLSKIYVGKSPVQNHKVGEPIFIYRKDTKGGYGTKYRSCITSYGVVIDVI